MKLQEYLPPNDGFSPTLRHRQPSQTEEAPGQELHKSCPTPVIPYGGDCHQRKNHSRGDPEKNLGGINNHGEEETPEETYYRNLWIAVFSKCSSFLRRGGTNVHKRYVEIGEGGYMPTGDTAIHKLR